MKGVAISLILSLLLVSLLTACLSKRTTTSDKGDVGGWVVGDFHEHSYFSDGGNKLDDVFDHSTRNFGVNFMVNTDHGGAYPRHWDGRPWSAFPDIRFEGDHAGYDKNGERLMWRWQELRDFSFDKVAAFSKRYPTRHYIQGLEWNSPATSHTSTGIIADSGLPIAKFEYQFDASDKDTGGGPAEGLEKQNGREGGNGEMLPAEARARATAAAVAWLMKHHRYTSWAIPAHPERGGNVKVEDFRNINNAGPDVAFGFEGIPGHQKHTLRAIFYPENALGGGTYGGVGFIAAEVGGIWDALLGEGRHFWLFASSDFHGTTSDFWPGEYHKTWIYAGDTTSATSILDGMRSGKVFVTNGDLINKLDFTIASAAGKSATMGETLEAGKADRLTIKIRFKSPTRNHNGDTPEVATIQLIGGAVTGLVDPDSARYTHPRNESTKVLKIFTAADWVEKDGWYEVNHPIEHPVTNSYFRIRGTNHRVGTPFETDRSGNPLPDSLAVNLDLDGPAEAWADLWFYSNPVFVNVTK